MTNPRFAVTQHVIACLRDRGRTDEQIEAYVEALERAELERDPQARQRATLLAYDAAFPNGR